MQAAAASPVSQAVMHGAASPAPAVSGAAEHPHIQCDVCLQHIAGRRFKCVNCADYDVCERCVVSDARYRPFFASHAHAVPGIPNPNAVPSDANPNHNAHTHLFLCVHDPLPHHTSHNPAFWADRPSHYPPVQAQAAPQRQQQPQQQQLVPAAAVPAPAPAQVGGLPVHAAVCDGCDDTIVGIRWKCSVCADHDLCSACYRSCKAGRGPSHPNAHLFYVVFFPLPGPQQRGDMQLPVLYTDDEAVLMRWQYARDKQQHPRQPLQQRQVQLQQPQPQVDPLQQQQAKAKAADEQLHASGAYAKPGAGAFQIRIDIPDADDRRVSAASPVAPVASAGRGRGREPERPLTIRGAPARGGRSASPTLARQPRPQPQPQQAVRASAWRAAGAASPTSSVMGSANAPGSPTPLVTRGASAGAGAAKPQPPDASAGFGPFEPAPVAVKRPLPRLQHATSRLVTGVPIAPPVPPQLPLRAPGGFGAGEFEPSLVVNTNPALPPVHDPTARKKPLAELTGQMAAAGTGVGASAGGGMGAGVGRNAAFGPPVVRVRAFRPGPGWAGGDSTAVGVIERQSFGTWAWPDEQLQSTAAEPGCGMNVCTVDVAHAPSEDAEQRFYEREQRRAARRERRIVKLQRKGQHSEQPQTQSQPEVRCPGGHTATAYATGQLAANYAAGSTVVCDVCGARDIQSELRAYAHCDVCTNWDACGDCCSALRARDPAPPHRSERRSAAAISGANADGGQFVIEADAEADASGSSSDSDDEPTDAAAQQSLVTGYVMFRVEPADAIDAKPDADADAKQLAARAQAVERAAQQHAAHRAFVVTKAEYKAQMREANAAAAAARITAAAAGAAGAAAAGAGAAAATQFPRDWQAASGTGDGVADVTFGLQNVDVSGSSDNSAAAAAAAAAPAPVAPKKLHIMSIAVDADWRGHRLGERLMASAIEHARESAAGGSGVGYLMLHVRHDNPVAFKLYQKLGFQVVRRVIGYYHQQIDGIRMVLRL